MGQFSENLNGEEEMEPLEMTKAPTFENFRPDSMVGKHAREGHY